MFRYAGSTSAPQMARCRWPRTAIIPLLAGALVLATTNIGMAQGRTAGEAEPNGAREIRVLESRLGDPAIMEGEAPAKVDTRADLDAPSLDMTEAPVELAPESSDGAAESGGLAEAEAETAQEQDGRDAPQDVSYGRVDGRIDPGNEHDWYGIEATSGDRLVIRVTRMSGNLDPMLTLYDESGRQVAFDDDGGGDYNPKIEYDVAYGQDYSIRVNSYAAASTGDYRIEVWWYREAPRPSCSSEQYTAEYFPNTSLGGGPGLVRCEAWPIDHDWVFGGPGGSVGTDYFSARWTGRAYIESGDYTFIARGDDGIRVWLDGQLIIDEWRYQAATEFRTDRHVSAGYHDIRVEYFEGGGLATAGFRWERRSAPACQGTPLYLNQTYGGDVGYGTDSRSYCFTAVAGEWVAIRAFAQGGSGLDPIVRLSIPGQGEVVNDDEAPNHVNSFLLQQLPRTAVYRLVVTRYGSTAGDFRLRVDGRRKCSIADVNGDCRVDNGDGNMIRSRLGRNAASEDDWNADINLDGFINTMDYALWSTRSSGSPYP